MLGITSILGLIGTQLLLELRSLQIFLYLIDIKEILKNKESRKNNLLFHSLICFKAFCLMS